MNTSQKIERVNRLAASERLAGPEKINAAQTIPSGNSERWAFCKAAAGAGNTIAAELDAVDSGRDITVNFTLTGGITNLSDGHISFVIGTRIRVAKDGDDWWYIGNIEGTEECP